MENFFISIHNRLGNTNVLVIGILYFKTETSPVAELIESEPAEPVGVVLLHNVAEFLYHSRLVVWTGNVAVSVELGHNHGLCRSAVKLLEAVEAELCKVVNVPDLAAGMAVPAPFRNVKWPAPVESHVFVHRPYIRLGDTLGELLFHFDLIALFGVLNAAYAGYSLDVRRVLVDNFAEPYKKVRNALIGSALRKGEPVAGRLVVDTEHHSAERTQVFCNGNKVIVGKGRVNCQRENNVLTVTAHVSHAGERLVVGSAV